MINNDLRKKIVKMVFKAGEGHIPSAFSIVEIISCLYNGHLKYDPNNPDWEDRDYFILSKGHGCAALFVVLERAGFITENDLNNFCKFDAKLGGHPERKKVAGVEASTGSLGHGLPYSIGIALSHKIQKNDNKIYVLCGDGECHEGTIWESALVAHNLKLDNLCCIIDFNHSASQIMPHPDLPAQWKAFGWNIIEIDGHDEKQIDESLNFFKYNANEKPTVIIADTIKGKGVSFLEANGIWHHKVPDQDEYNAIMAELNNE